MSLGNLEDANLVSETLSGDPEAFGRIVARYQSLICSLAYSATGSLSHSEDLAQETFLAAWSQLRQLREPGRLRSWLCGIARNKINNYLRREGREPLREATALDAAAESRSPEPLPVDHTISREEEHILWRALERIPANYREPLVLFYRENQSVEAVAEQLELSPDSVHQRLSRGRKLLAEEVAAFVEGALARTNPGRTFTVGVLAALPLTMATSSKAAVLGAAAVQGSVTAKAAGGLGILSTVLGPFLGFLGPWIQYRMMLDAAQTDAERIEIKRYFRQLTQLVLAFGACLALLLLTGGVLIAFAPAWFALNVIVLVVIFLGVASHFIRQFKRNFAIFRAQRAALGCDSSAGPGWEYRSRTEWLGFPLVHIRLGHATGTSKPAPVEAWFAVGDIAYGLLFAFGGIAIAPVSIGGLAIGLTAWGGLALGALAAGGLAMGGWAFGGLALGWQAFGGCVLGWNAAMGGLAVARDYALGGIAHAANANNELAENVLHGNVFFKSMVVLARHFVWLNLLWILPLLVWWRKTTRSAIR